MNASQRAERALIDAMHEAGALLEWDFSQTAPHPVRLALAERIVSVLSDAIYLDLDGDQAGPAA